MIIGAVVGAVLGAAVAYAYVESQRTGGLLTTKRERGQEVRVQAGVADYLRIGTAVYGIVRQLQSMVKLA
jgi:hypothetical protein